MRLLVAPSPFVMLIGVIPPRWRRYWRKGSVGLRVRLVRLITPGTLTRLVTLGLALVAVEAVPSAAVVAPSMAGAAVVTVSMAAQALVTE